MPHFFIAQSISSFVARLAGGPLEIYAALTSGDNLDNSAAKTGAVINAGGSSVAIFAGLSVSDWGVIAGIVTAVLGLAVQIFFQRRRDLREERAFAEERRGRGA